jgi:AcrR family transcriptional regulator
MPLQRETVVRAALHLLDEVGLDGLTMRRLAAYLEIQNPSLYWHFTNKQIPKSACSRAVSPSWLCSNQQCINDTPSSLVLPLLGVRA